MLKKGNGDDPCLGFHRVAGTEGVRRVPAEQGREKGGVKEEQGSKAALYQKNKKPVKERLACNKRKTEQRKLKPPRKENISPGSELLDHYEGERTSETRGKGGRLRKKRKSLKKKGKKNE